MKNYREIADSVFARREQYVTAQRKRKKLLASAGATLCAVSLLGGSVWYLNRPQHDIPVTLDPDENTVTTTTVNVPTEGENTTTTTTVNTTITTIDTTTDGGIVTPPTTAPTTAPSKTEPPKTTAPSKTQSPTVTTVSQMQPSATTPSKTEPFETTTTTTSPTKLLITADEPDNYDSNINESTLNGSHISGALKAKMKEYYNEDVVYAVVVEALPGREDAFWESTEELKRFYKEYWDVYDAFTEEAMRLNPSWNGCDTRDIEVWTDTMRANNEYWLILVAESQLLKEKYSIPYQEYIMDQRFEALKSICDTEPIVVWRQNYGPVYFNGYYVELTAEQINLLAEQGGYTFRLALADKIDHGYWEYFD